MKLINEDKSILERKSSQSEDTSASHNPTTLKVMTSYVHELTDIDVDSSMLYVTMGGG